MDAYVEDLLSPGLKGLLLTAEFVAGGHADQSLAAQTAQQPVDVLTERAEVGIRARTQCKHSEPIQQIKNKLIIKIIIHLLK